MVSTLSYNEKLRFNASYDKANELMKDKISSGEYTNLSIMDKIELAEAIALFKQCIKIHPSSWQSMWAIGLASQMLGENEEALEWITRAYEINPAIKSMLKN